MKPSFFIRTGLLALLIAGAIVAIASDRTKSDASDGDAAPIDVLAAVPVQPTEPIKRSDQEWKKILAEDEYYILREAGTERAFGDVYRQFAAQGKGVYTCAGCGLKLFSSETKFDSKSGWPSFYAPIESNVKTRADNHLGMTRTEVLCGICDGHLGHVFSGEGFDVPTGKRYCINGAALDFVPAGTPEKGE